MSDNDNINHANNDSTIDQNLLFHQHLDHRLKLNTLGGPPRNSQ